MTKKTNDYDIIIVGGGVAGLFSAYKILKYDPQIRVKILERNPKRWLGGRMNNEIFYGTRIVTGAGVGRKKKDKLLIALLKELKIPTTEFVAKNVSGPNVKHGIDIMKTVAFLRTEYEKRGEPRGITFKQFTKPILGDKLYRDFLVSCGYTDYENEDINETLYHYGFGDVVGGWTGLSVPWRILVETMADKIGWNHIETNVNVQSVQKVDNQEFLVKTDKKNYITKKVIIATTILDVMRLLKNHNRIYGQIHGQPFLRMYGKADKKTTELLKEIVPVPTIVDSPLYKIIPINADNGVYMIAYTDNRGAEYYKHKNHLENNHVSRKFWEKEIENALLLDQGTIHLQAIRSFYWPIGTHYFSPLSLDFKDRKSFLDVAQHPIPGMLVVGELMSQNQGWSEGALESVEEVVTRKWVLT
jgi:hypothetical protein